MNPESLLAPWEFAHTHYSDVAGLTAALQAGVLDQQSFDHYQQPHDHFVELIHRRGANSAALAALREAIANGDTGITADQIADAEAAVAGDDIISHRLSGNLRTDTGGDWQAIAMANPANGSSGTGTTAPTATTITLDGIGAPGSTSAYNGQLIVCGGVCGVITSNTNVSSPVVTIDGWHTMSSLGTTTSTPAAGAWEIIPGQVPAAWLALSNDATAPATTDTTLASEITTNGLARAYGTYAHTNVTGGTSSTVTSTYTLTHTWTASGTQSAQKAAVLNASANGKMPFENTFVLVSMVAADSLTETWTVNA